MSGSRDNLTLKQIITCTKKDGSPFYSYSSAGDLTVKLRTLLGLRASFNIVKNDEITSDEPTTYLVEIITLSEADHKFVKDTLPKNLSFYGEIV